MVDVRFSEDLSPLNPVRLALALNYSVFLKEVPGSEQKNQTTWGLVEKMPIAALLLFFFCGLCSETQLLRARVHVQVLEEGERAIWIARDAFEEAVSFNLGRGISDADQKWRTGLK